MTDNNIRIKILDEYKSLFEKELGEIGLINYLIEEFRIDPLNHNTFIKPIEKLKDELNKIIVPKPIEITNVIDESKHRYIRKFKDHSEAEVDKIQDEWDKLDQHLMYLKKMSNITKLYSSSIEDQISFNENKKIKRDTRSQENKFIKSFLENSSNYKMHNGKVIAQLNNVSISSVSRYFKNPKIVKEIYDDLDDRFTTLSDLKCNIESGISSEYSLESTVKKLDNVEFNFFYVKDKKEKLQRKIIPKANLELSKSKRNSNPN